MTPLKTSLSAAGVLAALALSPLAHADENGNGKYIGAMPIYVFPDSGRNVDDGIGGRGYFGLPLGGVNLEFNAFGYNQDRDAGGTDEAWGGGIDLMAPLASGAFRPFVLIGGGYIGEYINDTGRDNNGYANAGLGALIRLSDRWDLRAEGRYVAVFSDRTDLPDDRMDDVHAGLGLQYNFATPEPLPPPAPPAPPPPLPPADSDRDGVLDPSDRCPGTPAGVQVDTTGCPLDSDRDGVADYLDKCPNTPRGLRVDATGCVVEAQTIVLQNVNFEFNKDTITADTRTVLAEIAVGLKSQPDMKVELSGHTDSVGSDAYNKNLSQRRANSVKNFLVSQGVPASRLTAIGYGEAKPVADNTTDEGRAQNRRVEFRVISK